MPEDTVMKARRTLEMRTGMFELIKVSSRTNASSCHYVIKLHGEFRPCDTAATMIRNFFDPDRTRGSGYAFSWKFKDREQAVKLMTMSILKWGA